TVHDDRDHLGPDVPHHPALPGGLHLVPRADVGRHDRPVLHRATLLPRCRQRSAADALATVAPQLVPLPRESLGGEAMTEPMVRAEGVQKSFGRVVALDGLDLEVARGEVMVVVGPSGSGKSTFLRCINHLENVDAGRLWVDGELVGYRQQGGKLYELR